MNTWNSAASRRQVRSSRWSIFRGMVMSMILAAGAAGQGAQSKGEGTSHPSVPSYLVSAHLPLELQNLVRTGKFSEAETWIDARLAATGSATAAESEALAIERERLRRVRRDYSLTEERLREKLRRSLPDATDDDFRRWRDQGAFQSLVIDGQTCYFSREPSTLLRFNPEAIAIKERAENRDKPTTAPASGDPSGASTAEFSTEAYIRRALAAARDTGTTHVLPVRFRVKHKITVKPDVVPAGETIRCWVPIAAEYGRQSAAAEIKSDPVRSYEAPSTAPQRTLYNEHTAQTGQPAVFDAEWTYRSTAFVSHVDPARVHPVNASDPALREHLEERAPHVLFTPEMRKLAAEIVGDETNPYFKAQLIYSWIQKNIRWCPEMEYSTITNIVEKVSSEKRGDCGTQALLFVTLARLSGVPARWQSGWVTRPGKDGWNLHDWAEMYIAPYGWLPVDPSLAGRFRDSEDADLRDFFFGNCDGYRMIANTDHSRPFDPPKHHWRSDPVDNQRGEVEWAGGNLYYGDWSYDVEVESEEE